MQYNKQKFPFLGTILVIIGGTLLHFTFEWSNQNTVIAIFSAVNESTWEHMKLLFFPFAVFSILESFVFKKNQPRLLAARTAGLLSGLLFIPIIFYSYSGILGNHYAIIDILIFVFSVILAFWLSTAILNKKPKVFITDAAAILLLTALFAAFFIFTWWPPHIGLFLDPVSFYYGIPV